MHDVSEMQTNLAKLRSLSEDDKTENALLRSRIDEQSQLIMILKQRTDEAVASARTLECMNDELKSFREEAEGRLNREIKRYNMLDARFTDLASNHEELIKFKDEYKQQNEQLRIQNAKLKEDNERLFSKAIEEKDHNIKELDRAIRHVKEQCATLDQQNKQLTQLLRNSEAKYKRDVKELQHNLEETQERLKGANAKLIQESEQKANVGIEAQGKINKLVKEKDELLDLAMSRGKLIHETQADNKRLQQRIEDMERAVRDMETKFERDAAAVNKNMTVRQLRHEVEETELKCNEIIREFDAYKKHSGGLLKKERDLNEKLRHLVS